MTSRWERLKEIVAEAAGLPLAARADYLDHACAGDTGLRQEVETLLQYDSPGFLEVDAAPSRLGPYRILREIGRGGMGAVYEAERDDGEFHQRVAIKVIKRGMDTDAILRRFFTERQILARLRHPNITRLLDGGTFAGRPYFVMEFVEGLPIAAYCWKTNATLDARIHLFLAVCDAVEHAHRNLILHRDIKAGNILVDSDGSPKLLDFGIAKLLDEDGAAELTSTGMRPLTPQSASPEQVRGEVLTTASDVYSLGLLLYELMAGKPPYRAGESDPAAVARAICEQTPPKPSSLAAPADAKRLRGDLDNIILKALEKDPAARYPRAADLAGDLRRYLEGLPVQARAGGAVYRARKFIARHRGAVAAATLFVGALAASTGYAVYQERRADRRFDDLRQLAGSFLFEIHDAIAPLPGSTAARELVVKRALQYLDSMAREASGDVSLKRELAESYVRIGDAQGLFTDANLGKSAEARASYLRATALYREVLRANPADIRSKRDLALALIHLSTSTYAGDRASALANNHETIALFEEIARSQPLTQADRIAVAQAYFGIGESQMMMNHIPESLEARKKCVEILRGVIAQSPASSEAQRSLARAEARTAYVYLNRLHDPDHALEHLLNARQAGERLVALEPGNGAAPLEIALIDAYLSAVKLAQGDAAEAERLLRSAISTRAEALRADPRNFRVRTFLISDYARLGKLLRDRKRDIEAHDAFQRGFSLAAEMDPATARNPDAVSSIATLRAAAR